MVLRRPISKQQKQAQLLHRLKNGVILLGVVMVAVGMLLAA